MQKRQLGRNLQGGFKANDKDVGTQVKTRMSCTIREFDGSIDKEKRNMSTSLNPKITRRTFLKASAATAAIAATSDKLFTGPGSMLIPTVASAAPEVVTKHGNCAFCQQGDCQTIYKMIDGVVVKVEGDPDSPISQGKLCARGNSAIMNLYNAYRVKTPLKRTNPQKGLDIDPKW